ncbi:MAG: C39 family peptidase [Oscillospiraceae bacterium]|nr:C39 family peptidase [Oscillospiraceae bacterium]
MSQNQSSREHKRRYYRHRARLQRVTAVAALLLCLAALIQIARHMDSQRKTAETDAQIPTISLASEEEGQEEEEGEAELTDEEKLTVILSDSGEVYPQRLQELVEANAEAINFVYYYPEYASQGTQEIDLSQEAAQDTVPLLIQWDSRWGYGSYGDGLIGYTGCGPTCLSMVALYLTGDATFTPLYVANWADEAGYYINGAGSTWTLMTRGCAYLGLTAHELSLTESAMKDVLDQGMPIICSMGPGDFTESGHFLVITGYTDEGFTLNDPNSLLRSAQVWSYETLSSQIRGLWAYSAS